MASVKIGGDVPGKDGTSFLDDALIVEIALPLEERKLTAGFFLSGGPVKALFDDIVLSDGPFTVEAKSKLAITWGKVKDSFVR